VTIPKQAIEFYFNGYFQAGKYHNIELLNDIKISSKKPNKDLIIEGKFKWSQENILNEIKLGTKFIIKSEKFSIRYIRNTNGIKKPSDVISKDECCVSTNEKGFSEVLELLKSSSFDNPKPTELIKYITNFLVKKDDIILDFFAGSGTTGDAVMQLNAEDGGKRKFVLVQIDEPIIKKKSTEAYKFCTDNKFKPVISSITIERLNRAGEKIKADLSQKQGSLFDEKTLPDIGYKVFSCTKKPTVKQGEDAQSEAFSVIDNRDNTLDTLVNMLVATCKTLDIKITCLLENKLYQADDEIYLLANVDSKELAKYQDFKINLDGWADIDLTAYLNLGIGQKDNISVIY
jgi:adenine-specific DNA-methyltransferase